MKKYNIDEEALYGVLDFNKMGIDTCEFNIVLKNINSKNERSGLNNEFGEKCAEIRNYNNKYVLILYLPRFLRRNNIIPFNPDDFHCLCDIKIKVKEFLTEYFGDNIVACNLKKMEVNITSSVCEGAKASNVMDLLTCTYSDTKGQSTVYVERDKESTVHISTSGIVENINNLRKIKCYDKGRKENLILKNDLLRIEMVYLKRTVEKIYKNLSLDNILTQDSFNIAFDEYKRIMNHEFKKKIKNYLNMLKDEMLAHLKECGSPKEVYYQFKEVIFDVQILRVVLKKHYKFCGKNDSSRQVVRWLGNRYKIPKGTLDTVKKFITIANM